LLFEDQTSLMVMEDVDFDGQEEHIADLVTTAGFDTEWSGSTVEGEAQVNAKILLFNIFVGGRLSKSFGEAKTDLTGESTLAAQPGFEGFVTETPVPEPVDINTSAGPSGVDTVAFGGVEFKILPLNIVARGSYNFKNENFTGDLGARLQF
jgi:hypothetical protein